VATIQSAGDDRVLTVPNALSVLRLLCVPVFLWLLFGHHPHNRYGAGVLLGVLGVTDWVDGYVARHFDQVSTLGKVLDPVADRLLIGTAVIAILIDGAVPTWVGVLTMLREALVAGAAVGLALAGARRIDVQWAGKAGTFALMVAFPLFLVGHSNAGCRHSADALAWVAAVLGLCLSYYAAVTYIPLARRALREGRELRP
jgi:cardiolipin synthase